MVEYYAASKRNELDTYSNMDRSQKLERKKQLNEKI